MPYISNKELSTLVKIEKILWEHEREIFTEGGEKRYFTDNKGKKQFDYQVMVDKKSGATSDDFNDYWNLVEKIIRDKKEVAQKANAYNKANPERHRKLNREWARRQAEKRKNSQKGIDKS